MERLVGIVGLHRLHRSIRSGGETYDALFGGLGLIRIRRRATVCRRLVSHLSVTRLESFDFPLSENNFTQGVTWLRGILIQRGQYVLLFLHPILSEFRPQLLGSLLQVLIFTVIN